MKTPTASLMLIAPQLTNRVQSNRDSRNRSLWRSGFVPVPLALALAWFALSPTARAVLPPPDGGYPGGNTAEGKDALLSLTSGSFNTAIGNSALQFNTTGFSNTATGNGALYRNTSGYYNTANGASALLSNTTGGDNTASGVRALSSNTTGSFNTATGAQALQNNQTGMANTADGGQALLSNTTGHGNTANGSNALELNTTGDFNSATGGSALFSNTTGDSNTANGVSALYSNTTGGYNTAIGFQTLFNNRGSFNTANGVDALYHNTTAFFNTAMGFRALFNNTTGLFNTANGYQALYLNTTGGSNTANGVQALYRTSGGSNIALGFQAGLNLTTGSNNIDIGNAGVAGDSNKIRIGKQGTHNGTFIAGISGVAVTGGQVVVNASGKLGVAASSARYKEGVKPMDKTSEAILALKPVTFRYKEQIDPDRIPQFGLIAEEVEMVNPDLVVRDADGKINTVRYEAVNAMLLNEFLKEHRTVQELKAVAATQAAAIAQQQKQIEALTATVQKVSDQVALTKPTQQFATNP